MTAYLDLGDLNPYAVRASLRTGRRSELPARSPSITRSMLPVSRGRSELDSRSLWLTNEHNAQHVAGRWVDLDPHQGRLLQSGSCSLRFGGSRLHPHADHHRVSRETACATAWGCWSDPSSCQEFSKIQLQTRQQGSARRANWAGERLSFRCRNNGERSRGGNGDEVSGPGRRLPWG